LIVSIIVAMDRQGGIGKENRLPWRLSSDLKRFKELTMGHHLIMGRKTFESIGKPLPGRTMIVVSRDPEYRPADCLTAHSVEEALDVAASAGEGEAFIGGGAEIYRSALPMADRIYLTEVEAEVGTDTFFPEFDRSRWRETKAGAQPADEKNQFATVFRVLEREKPERVNE
jgi:dihydrofolate reductase